MLPISLWMHISKRNNLWKGQKWYFQIILFYRCLHRQKEKKQNRTFQTLPWFSTFWFFIRKVIRADFWESLSFSPQRKSCLFPLADSLRECTSDCLCIFVYTSVINGVSRKMSDRAVSVRRKGSCTDEHTQ